MHVFIIRGFLHLGIFPVHSIAMAQRIPFFFLSISRSFHFSFKIHQGASFYVPMYSSLFTACTVVYVCMYVRVS